jgi:hypothetical protein
MTKTIRWALAISALGVIGAGLAVGGLFLGRMAGPRSYARNMTGANGGQTNMLGNSAFGMMMPGLAPNGMMSTGMTGAALYGAQPLSISAAQSAVEVYLDGLRNSDLTVGEVIIFDNQAYVRVDEKSTSHAALEVLVDPVTLAVSPEPGANMMWNLKYGMTLAPARSAGVGGASTGMMGGAGAGMMNGYAGGVTAANPNDPMPVTVAQAVETAQHYLDAYVPGAKAEVTADAFYGYYTLEILRNGQTAGMLSVNGYTRQVILHTWHGRFIEASAK